MTIDINDWSKTALQRGWGPGWPSCSGITAFGGTAVVTADISGTRISVNKRIARLVDLLLDETERRGYRLRPGVCGGYNCRQISGTNVASNHSWGLATDLNWDVNPYVQPRRTDMPAWMPLLWNRYGFAWGGNYNGNGARGKADSMHYEFMGTPEQADQMTALALKELTGAPTPAAPPAPKKGDDLMSDISISMYSDGSFRGASMCEAGSSSQVVARAWVTYGAAWADKGSAEFVVTAQPSGAQKRETLQNNGTGWWEVPSGTRMVTVEGKASGVNLDGVKIVAAKVLMLK